MKTSTTCYATPMPAQLSAHENRNKRAVHREFPQKSHNKIHDISMTLYAVFHDARTANTENHRAYSSQIRKESQIYFQTENKESKRWFASCPTLRFEI